MYGIVELILALALAGGVALILMRQAASAAVGKTAYEILWVLDKARKPMNATEIMGTTRRSSGVVVNAIKFLHRRELISSMQAMGAIKAASDQGRYAISPKGRKVLAEGYKIN